MKTNLENYEERFVDYMEGQLDAAEMREVEAFVAEHPELEEDFKLFCSTKLEADTTVVYTKKESLMKSGPVIRPLFVRIVAAAACVALLIGIGIRFLKPHQTLEQQPMLAGLTPIEAQPIHVSQETQTLRTSDAKPIALPKSNSKPAAIDLPAPVELIAAVPAIEAKPLENGSAFAYDDIETGMFIELGERLASLEPLSEPDPFIESLIVDQKDQAIADLHENFFDNVRQTTKTLYKRTAKTVMDVYYTTDYRINEAKDQLVASR